MRSHPSRSWSRSAGALTVALLVVCGPPLAAADGLRLRGRPLHDALNQLRTRGLRLIFSSELVPERLRVIDEPRSQALGAQLAELLAPHGLMAIRGPGSTLLVVRGAVPPLPRRSAPTSTTRATPSSSAQEGQAAPELAYRERVTVIGAAGGDDDGSWDARRLDAGGLRTFGSHVDDDPVRAAAALPGVAAGNDFGSDVSARGSPYRHAGVVVDGVTAPWLRHAAFGRGEAGSLTMVAADSVDEVSLSVGAYDRREAAQLGPQVSLTLRQGSRESRRSAIALSATGASASTEGPLGSQGRGSWLVGGRKNYAEWPVGRQDRDRTVLGITDVFSKLTYDVTSGQHLSLAVVAGVSKLERDGPSAVILGNGANRAGLVTASWRSAVGSRMVIAQQVSTLRHAFDNRDRSGHPLGGGTNGATAYRLDLTRLAGTSTAEGGLQVRRLRGARSWAFGSAESGVNATGGAEIADTWTERSAYGSFRWNPRPGLTVTPGLRVSASSLVARPAVDRWVRAQWAPATRWRVHAATSVAHQLPGLDESSASAPGVQLRPERAWQIDLGSRYEVTRSVHGAVTAFSRQERDVLSVPANVLGVFDLTGLPGAVDGAPFFPRGLRPAANALSGTAHGVDVRLERRTRGLTGWMAYTYSVARHRDHVTGEAFAADFDERHSVNLASTFALRDHTRLGATFRAGSGMPTASRWVAHEGRLLEGYARNWFRLPTYQRLDLRADHVWGPPGRRATLFTEVVNVLNRTNHGLAGHRLSSTGEAVGLTERLFPRLLTAGLRIEF